MAQFRTMILTDRGRDLVAKIVAGSSGVSFTKVALSAQHYDDISIPALTDLNAVKQTAEVSRVTKLNTAAVKIEAAIDNLDVTQSYSLAAIGLYANDPDLGEILYGISGAEVAGFVPAYNGVTVSGIYINLTTSVSNADNVNLEVDPAATATIGDIKSLQKQISDLQAFIGYTSDDIYGIEVDFVNKKFTRLAGAANRSPGAGFDGIRAFGGRKRCNVTNDGKVAAYYGEAGFSSTGKLTQRIDRNDPEAESDPSNIFEAGTPVQVMVEQPKFYYRVVPLQVEQTGEGRIARKIRYYVSDTAKMGFKVHPAFIANGHENDKIYLSAFEGSLWDASAGSYILDDAQIADFNADLLCSVANAKPASGATQLLTRDNTRKTAQKRGKGWEQAYIATVSATELLMLVEYASFDMQKHIGAGNTSKPWIEDAVSHAECTGATVNLGNASGAITNGSGIQIVSYRGEENLYGNLWSWIDGINQYFDKEHGVATIYIADHNFTDDVNTAPYNAAFVVPVVPEGYISAFCYSEEYDWLFLPGEAKGNSALPVGDYFYQAALTGWSAVRFGGDWSYGSKAGAYFWTLELKSNHRFRNVGGRLVFIPSAG